MGAGLASEDVDAALRERRERVFLVLAGFFLGAMTLLNVMGITRFVHLGPLALAVGVLPYPLTFLCTDFISELYGRRRANFVVWVGLALNVFVIATMWLGNALPSMSESLRPDWQPVGSWSPPPWQVIYLSRPIVLTTGEEVADQVGLFRIVYACTAGSVLASMCAYAAAQFCDVSLFHFWKRMTGGRHLWLRNNASTMISQLVDATMVSLHHLPCGPVQREQDPGGLGDPDRVQLPVQGPGGAGGHAPFLYRGTVSLLLLEYRLADRTPHLTCARWWRTGQNKFYRVVAFRIRFLERGSLEPGRYALIESALCGGLRRDSRFDRWSEARAKRVAAAPSVVGRHAEPGLVAGQSPGGAQIVSRSVSAGNGLRVVD